MPSYTGAMPRTRCNQQAVHKAVEFEMCTTPGLGKARLHALVYQVHHKLRCIRTCAMSGVGETAAILQLVGNALLTAHTVSKACQSLYAASDEVRGLKGEVDAIRDRLESCRDAVNDAIPSNLRTSVQNNVKRALKDLDEIFSELNSLCNKVQKLETLQQRLSWICRHKKQADALQAKLRRAEESLSLAILPALMSVYRLMNPARATLMIIQVQQLSDYQLQRRDQACGRRSS